MLHIIIPTYEAERPLARLLPQLDGTRIIVADCGSSDATCHVSLRHGAQVALGAKGRGAQLRLGAKLACLSGHADDWFLFLHADSDLPQGWQACVEQAMTEDHPRYFRFRANRSGLKARMMDQFVALRGWALGLPYGDQGLLISRALYEQVGGYAALPLFEDVEMVRRVKRMARLRALPLALTTDVSDHWEQGLWRRGTRNLGLLWRYFRGADVNDLLKVYRS